MAKERPVSSALSIAPLLAAAWSAVTADPREASAGPPVLSEVAVVAFGRCDDQRLGRLARVLRAELKLQSPGPVLSEQATAMPAGGLQDLSIEEIRRALEAGRSQVSNMKLAKAQATLRALFQDIDRLPPGEERWNIAARARVELARACFFDERRAEAMAAMLEALRIQEDLKLDPPLFPPSAFHRAFEEARASLRRARRFALRVASARPKARVFLSGREVGRTPFERALPEGNYELIVGEPDAHSFARRLRLRGDMSLEVDVELESRFRAASGPCFEVGPSREDRLTAAALVAGALGVDDLVALRLERSGEDEYVAGALLEVARGCELREGRQRVESGPLPGMKGLAALLSRDPHDPPPGSRAPGAH